METLPSQKAYFLRAYTIKKKELLELDSFFESCRSPIQVKLLYYGVIVEKIDNLRYSKGFSIFRVNFPDSMKFEFGDRHSISPLQARAG